jgi:hypothetical protein
MVVHMRACGTARCANAAGELARLYAPNPEPLRFLFQTNDKRGSIGAILQDQYYFCCWKTINALHGTVGSVSGSQ